MLAGLKKDLRSALKDSFGYMHEAGSRVGLIVLPKHYYVPFPDLRQLRQTRPRWAKRSQMRGVAVDLDQQIEALHTLVQPFESEYRGNARFREATQNAFGPGFGYIEAQALHGFLRATKPARIIEVGSGVSTHCMLAATSQNAAEGAPTSITCVEPFPSTWLRSAPVRLVQEKVEDVDLGLFDELTAGDFLFIDSTHAVRVGGDVLCIINEILPRLRPGVYVHFHDIYFPYDFQRDADKSLFQWLETAMLHAYLIGNPRMAILFCLSHLHYDRQPALKQIFPDYEPDMDQDGLSIPGHPDRHFPSSLYLHVTA